MKCACLALLLAIACCGVSTHSLAAGPAKCTSIQAQCALEIGGYCNPKTGRWRYGFVLGRQYGGTNHGGAFDACISRKLSQQK